MKANKDLGQHFLKDLSVIEKITQNSFVQKSKTIIEVGPGQGAITKDLSQHSLPLYLVEKDERFSDLLQDFTDQEKILITDAMEINWPQYLKERNLSQCWLVSNLPYNVGTQLTLNFSQAEEIRYMTLMMQKEVGLRFLPQKSNEMNSLAVLAQTYFDVSKLCLVLPGAFNPPPKVDSIVLNFERKGNTILPLNQWKKLESFTRKLFQLRRKQIRKVLSLSYQKELVEQYLNESQIPFTLRSESLTLEQVYQLYFKFHP